MTTCPSGVHYQHLIDHARVHVEQTYRRPFAERWLRAALAAVLPYPARVRAALALPRLCAAVRAPRCRRRCARCSSSRRARRAARAAECTRRRRTRRAARRARKRVALLTGCVQTVIAPEINAATIRLLAALRRRGRRRSPAAAARSCITRQGAARERARRARSSSNCTPSSTGSGLDAIVANASGCGTHVKDYGYLFRDDAQLAAQAAAVSAKARDVTELLAELGLPPAVARRRAV